MSRPPRPKPSESERRLRHNFRLARLLKFLELVSGRGKWNPQSLMRELEVSERTVHRLRETLELAGVPLYFVKDENAYRVRTDYRFVPLNLSDDEAIGQAMATTLSESEAFKLPVGSKETNRKLSQTGSARVSSILEDVTRLTEVLDLKIADNSQQSEIIGIVQRALLDRTMLNATYRSPYEPTPLTFKLHPYRLTLIKQAWYLVGRQDEESQPRTYRIVRFQALKATKLRAAIPEDFDLKAFFGNAWSVYRGNRSFEIELRFTVDAADVVLEHTWHHTQQAKKHPNGEVTLSFTVDGLNEILRWVLGWAGRVRVVKPAELRNLIIEHHQKAIDMLR